MAFSARYDERTNSNEPEHINGDMQAYRHGGDGVGAKVVASRVQGYYPAGLSYVDVQVDANGVVQTAGGGGGGGGAATIADGADVVEGALADAAIVSDTTGTVNGKLRGLVKWAFERMPASLGQKTMAASLPVVLASDQSAVTISGTVTANVGSGTQPVSGTVTANAGTGPFPVSDNAGSLTVDAPVGTPVFVRLSDGSAAIATLPVSAAALPLPSGAATSALQTQPGVDIGDVTVNNAAGASAVNIQDGGNSITVDGSVTALDEDSATGTHANFTGSGANQTIVASNSSRKGATVFNDSGVVCYVKLAATASATSFTVKMVDQSYYEVPFKYTGIVDAFWASGSVRVAELT